MANNQVPGFSTSQKKTALLYLIAIVLGVCCGCCGPELLKSFAHYIAVIFVRLFKFISVPIIAVSIITTLAKLSGSVESGRIFRRTIFYTLLTTILSAAIAAILYVVYAPTNVAAASAKAVSGLVSHGYAEYLINAVPDNLIRPFIEGNVLAVLVIAAATGLAIAAMPNDSAAKKTMVEFFTGAQAVLFTMVRWLILVLPVGIFGFISELMVEVASGVQLGGLGTYFATILTANFVQMLVILPLLLIARGLNPIKVARAMMPALSLAFFSKSSAATLPLTMSCSENRLKVSPAVARFVLPICTTINMNGCAAFILITVVYLMQNAGIDITFWTLLVWIGIATLAAIGNAGVPMGCFFLSASLLAGMNVPIVLMGVILPFYAVIDMIETTLNVWSDSTVAAMVDHDLYAEKAERTA